MPQAGSQSVAPNGQPNANLPNATGPAPAGANNPAGGATTPGTGPNAIETANGGTTPGASGTTPLNVSGSSQPLGFSLRSGGTGLRVDNIAPGGYAQTLGLRSNDEVVSINGQQVNNQAEFTRQLELSRTQSSPLMLGLRRDGQFRMVQMNQNGPTTTDPTAGITGFGQGVVFAPTNGGTGLASPGAAGTTAQNGMLVSQITPNSWAANSGLMANDRIMSINGKPLDSQFGFDAQLQTALGANSSADLMINRNGQMMPLKIAGPGAMTSDFRPTGNFGNDFQTWSGNWSSTMGQVRQHYQNQLNQLNRLNEQINALRNSTLSSTGQNFDVARNTERFRTLQSDIEALGRQTNGDFQNQLNMLHRQLGQLNPSGSGATANQNGTKAAGGTNGAGTGGVPNTATNPQGVQR